MRRIAAFLVRNWPLKVAALALATLLYAGLALSQGASEFPGRIPIFAVNQPDDAVLLTPLVDVTRVRYVSTVDLGTLSADDFRATVDLSSVDPEAGPQSVRVQVEALPRGITVVEVTPARIQVDLDPFVEATVPVVVELGPPPANAEVGQVEVDPEEVTIRGAQTVVAQVVGARATVALDATGLNFRGDVELVPVDRDGNELQVDVIPDRALVTVPVITDRRQRTLTINPVITGSVGAGMRIASVEVTPPVVTVEGDADDLEPLTAADTEPIPVTGAEETIDIELALVLPGGVTALGVESVRVVIRLAPVTETRTYTAGVRIEGADPAASVTLSTTRVLVTLFGPADVLDELGGRALIGTVDVTGRATGQYELPVRVQVPGVSVADVSPTTITATIIAPTAAPSPTPSPVP